MNAIHGGIASYADEGVGPEGSLHAHLLEWVDTAHANRLNPHRRITVTGQSVDTTKVQAVGSGESVPDGFDYPILMPIFSPRMVDSTGAAIPGAIAPGQSAFVQDHRPGNPIITGRQVTTPERLPWVTDVIPGNGIASSPYTDPLVPKPTLTAVGDATKGISVGAGGIAIALDNTTGLTFDGTGKLIGNYSGTAPLFISAGVIRIDQTLPLTWSALHTFNAGISIAGCAITGGGTLGPATVAGGTITMIINGITYRLLYQ